MDVLKAGKGRVLRHFIAMPFIWMPIFPIILLDIFTEIYHHICFPLYRLKKVKRSSYIKIDRYKLKYLSPVQKIECMYCGYVSGMLHYASEIVTRTEQYWCGIQHKKTKDFQLKPYQKTFTKYGDKKEFEKRYKD